MASHNDESVSPMTRSPRGESPARAGLNGSTAPKPSALRLEVSNDDIIQSPQSSVQLNGESTTEVHDYLNEGLPHESVSPFAPNGHASATSSPKIPSTLKPTALRERTPGTSTPPARRSVQFARTDTGETPNYTRHDSWGQEEADTLNRDRRGQSLMSKLKALAGTGGGPGHTRTSSGGANSIDEGTNSAPMSPGSDRHVARVPHTLLEEGSDADADAEETADESTPAEIKAKRKRRTKRPQIGSPTPTTPKMRAASQSQSNSPTTATFRPNMFLKYRNTDQSDEQQRGGMSEGEGRDRLGKESAWRRGSSWMTGARSGSYSGLNPGDGERTPSSRRPSAFRRVTGIGGASDGEAVTPRRPFLGGNDRAATFGAQKWRALKHGLKLLGQRKEEHKVDFLKSAELMAELRAGAPAALMLASMIQRDEHGNKRIPVLLEQLKLRVTDSRSLDEPKDKEAKENDRHIVFRIELEYGSGLNRMKWVIHRSLKDFANLHLRYKIQASSDKYIQLRGDNDSRPKQPRFPKSAFPYLRGVRGLGESEEDEADIIRVDDTVGEATHSETERRRKKRRASFSGGRRKSSTAVSAAPGSSAGGGGPSGLAAAGGSSKRAYNERQRKRLEQYLQEMIRWLIFRADSNRLCKFLELSALGVRLAAEGSYHGKEGFLVIQSSKGIDFRRLLTPKNVIARHSPKWFLVRHSYIVCVESPENMHIYDVFLVDSEFRRVEKTRKLKDSGSVKDLAINAKSSAAHTQHHKLKLQNSERRIKLLAKNERQLRQFEESIDYMISSSRWSKPNRFGSFAPVRTGVYAQWLVDGRDYMWNVSRAINMAKDVIYIHDWWLSPQLYMRRPAAISQKWRLDRLLQKKAREGVKVFIIIYRNVEAAIPIDSEFTKFSMLDLHPNIFVQRSPNQFKKNQFFFAHHEKICIVDHTVAFVGGIDLCFGRWDTPQHSVVDDKPTGFETSDQPKDADHCQLWPGKDYSNPRVQDFYQLNEPYAEMYDRTKTPRMPWHDIAMQVVGQPARDLTRHFVQRWNYVLRGRKPTRPTPFLLPPPDYVPADLEALGLSGTCEVQILRSASNWSLGIENTEHSIMNAYCKMIEESEHFVYMENQFFITSCMTMNTKIVNKIGDAIVERALRAAANNESWRCVIIIPLMPGFQNTVDEQEGTSVRLIMQCQFRSICRGSESIFGRLKENGLDPEDWVQFYSLRSWGKIGPNKALVTEQLYIHAKCIIVDDRIALIGSANINERSMLGNRDSECAAVVRDTDMLWSTMDGQPYLVGRFAHTLRMRLMREHLGIDVDEVMEEERRAELDREEEQYEATMNKIYDEPVGGSNNHHSSMDQERAERIKSTHEDLISQQEDFHSFNHDIDWEQGDNPNLKSDRKKVTSDKRVTNNAKHQAEVSGQGNDHWDDARENGLDRGRDSVLVDGVREVLATDIAAEGKGTLNNPRKRHTRASPPQEHADADEGPGYLGPPPQPRLPRMTTEQLGLPQLSQLPALPIVDDTDIGGPPVRLDADGKPTNYVSAFNPLMADIKQPLIDKDCMRDPINDAFSEDIWRLLADNNTKIFRRVFRCNPDSEVKSWHDYREFTAYAERFAQMQNGGKSQDREAQEAVGKSGPPGATLATPIPGALGHAATNLTDKVKSMGNGPSDRPMGNVSDWAKEADAEHEARPDTGSKKDEKTADDNTTNEKQPLGRNSGEVPSPIQPAGNIEFPSLTSTMGNNSTGQADHEKAAGIPTRTRTTFSTPPTDKNTTSSGSNQPTSQGSTRRRRRGTTRTSRSKAFSGSDDLLSYQDAEQLLNMVQGHLVCFPYDWLVTEEHGGNWLYQVDQVAPLQI
jgi:phospholipase D1/2